MGKIIPTTINSFGGGISNDPRSPFESMARMVTHFNAYDNPRKLTPYRSSESGDSDAANTQKRRFTIAYHSVNKAYYLYALGQDADGAAGDAEVEYKELTTSGGGENDLGDATWNKPGNNVFTSSSTIEDELWLYYEKADRIYFARDGRYIDEFDPDGSSAAGSDELDLTSFTTIAQGIVHSKDDIMYIPYDNKIAKHDGSAVNGTAWIAAALTLPTHFKITSISEYGDYIAIAAAHKNNISPSRLFLWDKNTTDVALSESVDLGEGVVKVMEEIEGELILILDRSVSFTFQFKSDWTFKRYRFGLNAAEIITKLSSTGTTNNLSFDKQKIDNRLFFGGRFSFNGAMREGVFSIGRGNSPTGFTIYHEYLVNNDTALTDSTASEIVGFFRAGDHMFIAYKDNGTWALSKTVANNTGAASRYLSNSIYEKRFATGGSGDKKDLIGVTVTYEYLPTNASVALNYRTDENTSWTEVLTDSTANSISSSAVASLPKDYKEVEFQIESRGGAEITGLEIMEEITGKKPYG